MCSENSNGRARRPCALQHAPPWAQSTAEEQLLEKDAGRYPGDHGGGARAATADDRQMVAARFSMGGQTDDSAKPQRKYLPQGADSIHRQVGPSGTPGR